MSLTPDSLACCPFSFHLALAHFLCTVSVCLSKCSLGTCLFCKRAHDTGLQLTWTEVVLGRVIFWSLLSIEIGLSTLLWGSPFIPNLGLSPSRCPYRVVKLMCFVHLELAVFVGSLGGSIMGCFCIGYRGARWGYVLDLKRQISCSEKCDASIFIF